MNEKPKDRVVVDIRALNKITMPDVYPVFFQTEDFISNQKFQIHFRGKFRQFFLPMVGEQISPPPINGGIPPRTRDFSNPGYGIP